MEEIAQALSKTSWRTWNMHRDKASKNQALLSTTGKNNACVKFRVLIKVLPFIFFFLYKCKDLVCYSTTGPDVLRSSLIYISVSEKT